MKLIAFGKTSFAGHETFPFRYTWMPKAVAAIREDPRLFGREDALVTLGVGKNMVKSIRHWGLAFGLLEEDPEVSNNRGRQLRVTELGEQLFGEDGWDPYFEDLATAWWLHWRLCCTPEKATTWYWLFNHMHQPEFRRDQLQAWLQRVIVEHGIQRTSPASLKRDIDCCLRTYVPSRATRTVPLEDTLDCPLVELGLIREFGGRGNYMLQRGDQPSLPDGLFAAALAEYIGREAADSKTLPLDVVAFAAGSPGRVFCLSEDALLARLEKLNELTSGGIVFDETAGLRQILIHDHSDPAFLLDRCFTGRLVDPVMLA